LPTKPAAAATAAAAAMATHVAVGTEKKTRFWKKNHLVVRSGLL
jgi:hypothetical protein